jgi:Acetyltransferases, including N-acetylases of ribosomal proteins
MMNTVFFRAFEPDDSELIYKWMNDDELKRLSVGLNKRMSREECHKWVIDRMNTSQYQYFWAICSQKDDSMIGYAFITNIHYINRSAEFGGIVIGDPTYHDGLAWIESYLFVLDYVFDRLNINRFSDTAITEHLASNTIAEVFYFQREGVLKEAVYKNGRYYDLSIMAILSKDYHEHKTAGDYELKSIIRRFSRRKDK